MTLGAILVFAVATWLMWEHARRKVHTAAAVGLFVPLIILVFATSFGSVSRVVKFFYRVIGSAMVLAGLLFWYDRINWKSAYATLIVETVLVACFAAFWLVEYLRFAALLRAGGSDVVEVTGGVAVVPPEPPIDP
jgi:hypothetical protein